MNRSSTRLQIATRTASLILAAVLPAPGLVHAGALPLYIGDPTANEKPASGIFLSLGEGNIKRSLSLAAKKRWGNDYMHARYYSPNLGRFMSVDPVGGSVGSSQSWNRYSYVQNNPLAFVDPTGETLVVAGQDELDLLKDALVEAGAEKIADSINTTETDDGLIVSGIGKALMESGNKTVSLVASLVNDSKNVTTFSLTNDNVGIGGGVARVSGANSVDISINAEQVSGLMVPGSKDGSHILGPMSPTIALVHELGHAKAHFGGYPMSLMGFYEANAERAIMYENAQRGHLDGPLHFTRTSHKGRQLDSRFWGNFDLAKWIGN